MAGMPEAVKELRRALGAALAGYRSALPLDQGDVARLTNYSRTSISHIEAGRQFPNRKFWQTVDQAFDAHGELLAHFDRVCDQERQLKIAELRSDCGTAPSPSPDLPPRGDDDWQRDDVNRRELLRLMTLTSSLLAIPAIDLDRLRHRAENARYLDRETVDDYERLNASLWDTFSKSRAKREVLPLAKQQLAILNRTLNEPQSSDIKLRLSALAGDLFQLCGEIFFDGDNYADAAHCYSLAAYASKEARNADLWACAMTRHAFISIYERQYGDAAPLLSGAAQLALRGDRDRSTRYWVAAVQAQTFAGLGDLLATERALDKAEQVNQLRPTKPSGWLRFEGSRLDEERGACYVTLARPDLAEPVLMNALNKEISIRRRGGVLTDLAIAGAQRGDVAQTLLYGAAALDTVRQTGSTGYVGRKVADLRRNLQPFLSDRHVRYLDAQIKKTVAA
jgi:DNA-binding XRE family transcriptional regulator